MDNLLLLLIILCGIVVGLWLMIYYDIRPERKKRK